jgi:Flp pilus assembly protein TadG
LTITPTPTARRRQRERGQSVAELAIVLPVLLLVLLSILQIGFLLFTQVGLINAAREAARNASNIPVATTTQASAAATEYYIRLTTPSTGFLARNVGGYNGTQLVNTGSPRTSVCYYSFTDASNAAAVMARVEVQYRHPLFVPLISTILDAFDGASDGGFRMSVTEDIRVANPVPTTTDIGPFGSPTCNT